MIKHYLFWSLDSRIIIVVHKIRQEKKTKTKSLKGHFRNFTQTPLPSSKNKTKKQSGEKIPKTNPKNQ